MFVRLEEDGISAWGEASPSAFYDETDAAVAAMLERAADWLRDVRVRSVADLERLWSEAWAIVSPSRAAQCALDVALWDWLAQKEGTSVSELAWGSPAKPVRTFGTIGLSTPDELDAKIEELREFSMIKVKSDASADLEPVRRIRERNGAMIAVDANCAWAAVDLPRLTDELTRLKVEFIEQPFPPGEDLRLLRNACALPIMADESCVVADHVERIAGHFDGFNIKLVKCGGITPALRMARVGRELGLKTMVGCMLESSVLIAAGAVVAQQTDYADLDGAWLLSDDPFRGWQFDHGLLTAPHTRGLGVSPLRT